MASPLFHRILILPSSPAKDSIFLSFVASLYMSIVVVISACPIISWIIFRLVSFSQKRVQNVCRKWWQLKCGNSSGSRRSAFASSSSFALQFFFEFDVLIPKGIECHLVGLINKQIVLQVLLYLLLHITKRSPALLSFRNFVGCYEFPTIYGMTLTVTVCILIFILNFIFGYWC